MNLFDDKPVRVKRTAVKYVWHCGISEHNHATEKAARNCISSHLSKLGNTKGEIHNHKYKYSLIYQLRHKGITLKHISALCSISPTRVRKIFLQVKELKNTRKNWPFDNLGELGLSEASKLKHLDLSAIKYGTIDEQEIN